MRIDVLTIFPEICDYFLGESIIGRARKEKKVELFFHNIRDFAKNKHKQVDDYPYGGGRGMVLMAEPIYACHCDVMKNRKKKPLTILLSPRGYVFDQDMAKQFVGGDRDLILICGHYEGIDQRLIDEIVDIELSIGNYVLTGGEIGAIVVADAVTRLLPGVLPAPECFEQESHYEGKLENDHYTRPQIWKGREVPEVLLSGHHKKIEEYRAENGEYRTEERKKLGKYRGK